MVVRLPLLMSDGRITEVHKKVEDIEKDIDKIIKLRHNFVSNFGKYPDIIVINEDDYRFIEHYLQTPALCMNWGIKVHNLFGMKVLKMKAKGFIFAYE